MEHVTHSISARGAFLKWSRKWFRSVICIAVSSGAAALMACNSTGSADSKTGHSSSATGAGAAQTGAPDASHPLVIAGHAIIARESVGPLHLGTWRRPAMSFVYAIGATAGAHGEDMIAVRGIGQDTLTLMFVDDTLRRIDVNHRGPHTVDGIGIGTALDSLAAQRGSSARLDAGVRTVTLDRYCGIAFRSDTARKRGASVEQRVGSIIVGPCAKQRTS